MGIVEKVLIRCVIRVFYAARFLSQSPNPYRRKWVSSPFHPASCRTRQRIFGVRRFSWNCDKLFGCIRNLLRHPKQLRYRRTTAAPAKCGHETIRPRFSRLQGCHAAYPETDGRQKTSFREELLGSLLTAHILDLYDIHARSRKNRQISDRTASLLRKFIEMLYNGDCIRNRCLDFYASRLCISPHYLSKTCKKASGKPATYWIDRFTLQ